MDVHYKFSTVTFRDADGRIAGRERLEHPHKDRLRQRFALTLLPLGQHL
jgi:hypothetical protein